MKCYVACVILLFIVLAEYYEETDKQVIVDSLSAIYALWNFFIRNIQCNFYVLCCTVPGVGCQFLAVAVGIIVMALAGMFNVHRHGSMNSAGILLYALASTLAGYVSATHYRMMGGQKWVSNINLTTMLFAGWFSCQHTRSLDRSQRSACGRIVSVVKSNVYH